MTFRFLLILMIACFSGCSKNSSTSANSLRISTTDDPHTLDPRQARDLPTANVIYMLYEGLMRSDSQGQPAAGIAESFDVSEDKKVYTFYLRKSFWSDGAPVLAEDFVQSWKSSLSSTAPSPNAYQLYVIRGAQAAREGKISIDEIGVKAIDPFTLVVELENPTPFFLQLASTYFYFPVHISKSNDLTFNGPFKLNCWARHDEVVLSKNQHYWNASSVKLDEIALVILDEQTALRLFENGELDWVGSPLSTIPTDAIAMLKKENKISTTPGAGTHWIRINTSKEPFNQVDVRRAFSLAINRQDLIDHILQGNQSPALGIVPSSFGHSISLFKDNSVAEAQSLINKKIDEEITLTYTANERNQKIAQVLQQQWKQAFNIDVKLQSLESKVFFERLKSHNYQMALGSWYADFRDPISFLEVFKEKNNGTNNTEWENPNYLELLALSSKEMDPAKRSETLKEAEKLLIDEMPIIPLFFASYLDAHNPRLKGVYFSPLGYIDLKNAYLEPKQK